MTKFSKVDEYKINTNKSQLLTQYISNKFKNKGKKIT